MRLSGSDRIRAAAGSSSPSGPSSKIGRRGVVLYRKNAPRRGAVRGYATRTNLANSPSEYRLAGISRSYHGGPVGNTQPSVHQPGKRARITPPDAHQGKPYRRTPTNPANRITPPNPPHRTPLTRQADNIQNNESGSKAYTGGSAPGIETSKFKTPDATEKDPQMNLTNLESAEYQA